MLHGLADLNGFAPGAAGVQRSSVGQVVANSTAKLNGVALDTSSTFLTEVDGLEGVAGGVVKLVIATSGPDLLEGVGSQPVGSTGKRGESKLDEGLGEVLGVVLAGESNVDLLREVGVELGLDDGLGAVEFVLKASLNMVRRESGSANKRYVAVVNPNKLTLRKMRKLPRSGVWRVASPVAFHSFLEGLFSRDAVSLEL